MIIEFHDPHTNKAYQTFVLPSKTVEEDKAIPVVINCVDPKHCPICQAKLKNEN